MERTRNTKQKQMILDILKNAKKPLSINDIYEAIKEDYPSIAKSTIYRNIDVLIKQDAIDKYYLSDNELFYKIKENKHQHSHYVICESCNKMFDLPVCPLHDIEAILEEKGFTMKEHYVQISGKCKECKDKECEKKYESKRE